MGLFKNAAAEWEKTMTENDLDKMEAQGLDVSAYRAKLAARRAQEAEQAKKDKEMWQNPTNLEKLTPYIATPRSTETPFFKKVAGKHLGSERASGFAGIQKHRSCMSVWSMLRLKHGKAENMNTTRIRLSGCMLWTRSISATSNGCKK